MSSLKRNVLYNILKSVNAFVFPLITFSYVTHVLSATGVGKVDFIKSYTSYFCSLAMLGSMNYAIREASKIRNNRLDLSRFVHEILIITFISVLISCFFFFLFVYIVSDLKPYRSLLYVNSLSILLVAVGMEWLYNAVEDYKYIAIRSCIIQVLSLLLTVLLVHSEEDFLIYAFIMVIATAGSNIFNLIHSKKYVDYVWMGNYHLKNHLKPIMTLFGMTLCVQIFTHLDATMLGFMVGDISVGLYSAAIKMSNVVIYLIIAITAVLAPRIAYFSQKKDWYEIQRLSYKAVNCILLIGIPAMVGLILLSPEIIDVFNGRSYQKAIVTAQMVALRVLLVPLNTFIMVHLFVSIGKEKLAMFVALLAAFCNIFFNLYLIPVLSQNGAALATVIAEIMELIINIYLVKRILNYEFNSLIKNLFQYIFGALLILIMWSIFKCYLSGYLLILVLVPVSIIVYFVNLLIFHNCEMVRIWDKIKKKSILLP